MNKHLLCVIAGILILSLAAAPLSRWYATVRRTDEELFVDTGEPGLSAESGSEEQSEPIPALSAAAAISLAAEPLPGAIPAELEDGFVLREHEGEIAVFLPGENEPGLLTGIPVSVLRSTDQAALRQGIFVESVDEVAALVEDLGS